MEREAEVEHGRLGAMAEPHRTTTVMDGNPTRSSEAGRRTAAAVAAEEGDKPPSSARRIPTAEQ